MAKSSQQAKHQANREAKIGLVLSGGGARGAYQAGVMQAVTEILESEQKKVSVITGASAGAINASLLASYWENPRFGAEKLAELWCSLHADQVFKTDAFSLGKIGMKWAVDATLGGLYKKKLARSLLNTDPLRRLIGENISIEKIGRNLQQRCFESLSVTAMDYASATSVSFVQSAQTLPMWDRYRRRGEQTQITVDHVMGSSAIPLFFPPVQIGANFYGDGCVRNTAPVSSAIHLGSEKLIVMSVRRPDSAAIEIDENYEPSIARVLGVIMNALLLDAIDLDMERLDRINETLNHIPDITRNNFRLRRIEHFWLRPSIDIGHLASGQFDQLPPVIRYLLGGLGSSKESSEITSYLLFEPEFCAKLVEIGYKDTHAQADALKAFLNS